MKVKKISDKELINRYLDGDTNSLESLINNHKNRVFAYILMVVKDRQLADDIFPGYFYKSN